MLLSGCATIRVGMIPPPSSDAKLRVSVHAFSQKGPVWPMPHETFVAQGVQRLVHYLRGTGIFTIVSNEDVKTVLDGQRVARSQLLANNSVLARQVGKALYADYILLVERMVETSPFGKKELVFAVDLINTDTGRKYSVKRASTDLGQSQKDAEARAEVFELMYRELFREAQKEMMAAAAQKSSHPSASAPAAPPPAQPAHTPPPAPAPTPQVPETAIAVPRAPSAGPQKLVIFDFEAPEQYKTIAHIVTESFREEILLLNQYVLINRENLQQVLKEQALQQTGLLDEKQAVKTGKGLAAKQVVFGGLGVLGKTYVLQIKLIDVETYATLNLVSAKFSQGKEDEILEKLPELARKLASR